MASSGINGSARDAGAGLVRGCVLGSRYRLEEELGRGAMGVVWSAVDLAGSEEVALKIVVEPDANLRRRLSREGRVCKELRHRNVAEVHDVGETAAGQPFLVMQRLRGETLAEALERTPRLPDASAAAIALDIARALAAAHAVGVVHRDLKPANIFLHRAPGVREVVVKVLDFGVCKVQEPGDDLRTELGAPVGSLAYMAPEQAAGEADIDGRADLWSLGAVLFEMLAGRRLFQGSRMNVIRQLLYDPLPPFAAELPGTDAALVTVIARCLARERDDRWATADEAAAALLEACRRAEHSEGPRTRVSFSREERRAAQAPEPGAQPVSEPARSATLVLGPPRPEAWPDRRALPARPAAPPEGRPSWTDEPSHASLPAAPPRPGVATVRMTSEEALRAAAEVRPSRPSSPGGPAHAAVALAAWTPPLPGSAPAPAAFAAPHPAPLPAHAALTAAPGGLPIAASAAPSGLAALPSWFAAASAVALVVLLSVILFLMG